MNDLYAWLKENDIIEILKPLLKGGYRMRIEDGKFWAEDAQGPDTPWIHVKHARGKHCNLWHRIMFDVVSSTLPANLRFVPSGCQECWKVVVRPKTLKQLYALWEVQKGLPYGSKLGIEMRPTVHGHYGGYFYSNSLPDGLEMYSAVREAVNKNTTLGHEIAVILKRGCTEFEMACGDSLLWNVTPQQKRLEELINEYVVDDIKATSQPPHLQWKIQRRWIEWAYANGDETYKEFTDGKPLYPAYRTYHHLVGKTQEEIETWAESEISRNKG